MITADDNAGIEPRTITVSDEAPAPAAAPPVWGEDTIQLLFPLKTASGTISSITLREPNSKKLEEIERLARGKGNYESLRITASILSGIPLENLEELNVRDIKRIAKAANPLLGMEEEGDL